MEWKDIGKNLAAVAPTLATALGGPLAGAGVAALEKVFGLTDATPETVNAALATATPDQMLALKHEENAFKLETMRISTQHEEKLQELDVSDRASARNREVAVKDFIPGLLAIAVTVGFFGLLAFMCVQSVPKESETLLNVLIGSLGTTWVSIITYYFGSSRGSDRKTELLASK